jgi:hypothetical protein
MTPHCDGRAASSRVETGSSAGFEALTGCAGSREPRMAETLQWPSQEACVDAAAFGRSRRVLDLTQRRFSLRHRFVVALSAAVLVVGTDIALAQLPGTRIPGGCDVPVSQRTSETGCYLTATMQLPQLPRVPLFWHVYSYPSRAAADAIEKQPASIVVESLGTIWLFAIADAQWQAATGERVARIGPLPVLPAKQYTARFMEAIFPPGQGLQTAVHRHSGPAAWYVVSGAQCLRTPDATTVLRRRESGFVAAGPPMMLTSLGPDTRRSLVLVFHDSEQPWMTVTTDWRPVAGCPEK